MLHTGKPPKESSSECRTGLTLNPSRGTEPVLPTQRPTMPAPVVMFTSSDRVSLDVNWRAFFTLFDQSPDPDTLGDGTTMGEILQGSRVNSVLSVVDKITHKSE